jgi:hypothetical protein
MRTFEWAIEDIITAFPSLSLAHYAVKAVAIMKRVAVPCDFLVQLEGFHLAALEGDTQFVMNVIWNPESAAAAERMERTEQRTPIVEGAAIALAALLFAHLVPDSEMQVTSRGAHADYWLPKRHQVVEVSGTERFGQMARRLQQKRRQVLANPFGLDGYVVLCCFARSQRLIRWRYHPQQE